MGNGAETAATPLASDVRAVLHSLAASLQTPLALLSRDDQAWRFEGEWLPPGFERDAELPLAPVLRHAPGDPTATDEGSGRSGIEAIVEEARRSLRRVLGAHDDRDPGRFGRRLYAFSRRLGRETNSSRIHSLILRTIARHVRARIGALALYQLDDEALAIMATYGYPAVLVEHLRIAPGEGILGRAYAPGRADGGQAE